MNRLSLSDFESYLNQTFHVIYGNDERLPVTLADVAPSKYAPPDNTPNGWQPFSILFQSTITDYLRQSTYRVEHPEFGSHALFLVPIGPNEHGMRYEAVFN